MGVTIRVLTVAEAAARRDEIHRSAMRHRIDQQRLKLSPPRHGPGDIQCPDRDRHRRHSAFCM